MLDKLSNCSDSVCLVDNTMDTGQKKKFKERLFDRKEGNYIPTGHKKIKIYLNS